LTAIYPRQIDEILVVEKRPRTQNDGGFTRFQKWFDNASEQMSRRALHHQVCMRFEGTQRRNDRWRRVQGRKFPFCLLNIPNRYGGKDAALDGAVVKCLRYGPTTVPRPARATRCG